MSAFLASFTLIAAANFCYIALKAAAQRAVAWGRYMAVVPISGLLAVSEAYVVKAIAHGGPFIWVPLWLGGSTGCLCSMWLTRKWSVNRGN